MHSLTIRMDSIWQCKRWNDTRILLIQRFQPLNFPGSVAESILQAKGSGVMKWKRESDLSVRLIVFREGCSPV